MITWENYEEYIMMYADGELQPAEATALMQFIDEHPELKSELVAYGVTRFSPDETQVYEQQQSLLKTQPVRTIAFPHWQRYAVAAGVAALICISVVKWGTPGSNNNTVAANTTSTQPAQSITVPTVNSKQPDSSLPAKDVATNQKVAITKPMHSGSTRKTIAHDDIDRGDANFLTKSELAALPMTEIKKLAIDKETRDIPPLIAIMVPQIITEEVATETNPHKRSLLDRLPIDESNRDQVKEIKNTVAGTAQQVNNIKESLFSQGLSIRINQKTIVLNF